MNSGKRKYETQLIEKIRVIGSEKYNFDIITFTKNFFMSIENVTKILILFSNDNYFKDWIIPIKVKNTFNIFFRIFKNNIII